MIKSPYSLVLLACTVSIAACGPRGSGRTTGSSEYQKEVAAESLALERSSDTTYVRRMRNLIARSRAVPVDSLARMFTQLSHASKAQQPSLRQGIACEYFRIGITYGSNAFERAIRRMEDSLTRAGVDLETSKRFLNGGAGPPLEMSDRACPGLPTTTLPDSLEFAPKPTPGR
jgi:hypothetical protein